MDDSDDEEMKDMTTPERKKHKEYRILQEKARREMSPNSLPQKKVKPLTK